MEPEDKDKIDPENTEDADSKRESAEKVQENEKDEAKLSAQKSDSLYKSDQGGESFTSATTEKISEASERTPREVAKRTPSITMSVTSASSKEDGDAEDLAPEFIEWEWEQELAEYDEPDIYPSEKDYIWVPVQVEIEEGEEDEESVERTKEPVVDAMELTADGMVHRESEVSLEAKIAVVAEEVKAKKEATKQDSNTEAKREQLETAQTATVDTGKVPSAGPIAVSQTKVEDKSQELSTPIADADRGISTQDTDISTAHLDKSKKSADSETAIAEKNIDPDGKMEQEIEMENIDNASVADVKTDDVDVEKQRSKEKQRPEEESKKGVVGDNKMVEPGESTEQSKDATEESAEARSNIDKAEHEMEPESREVSEDDKNLEKEKEEDKEEGETTEAVAGDDEKKSQVEDKSAEARSNIDKPEHGMEPEPGEVSDDDKNLRKEEDEDKDEEETTEAVVGDDEEKAKVEDKESEEQVDTEKAEKEAAEEAGLEGVEGDEVEKAAVTEERVKDSPSDTQQKGKDPGKTKDVPRQSMVKSNDVHDSESMTTVDAADQADDFDDPGIGEPEPEVQEPPPKRYKTVLVKTLVHRPPKIHYVPEEERKTHVTSDKYVFRKRPITLVKSYGYDCQRMANLHVLDKDTLVYMSGFVLTFLSYKTGEQSYLRCIGDSCFGALAVHPSKRLFAAAEKGTNPIVGIWSWPKLQLFRKLRNGTEKAYASINFSPCGKFLATQGGEPDYLITVFNWLKEMPVVRVKSHAQDVYRVTFSKELAGRLTTSGLCHIKFWKMASTFTGLKLKGDIGRFGRTEISDIEGYIEMPDGKVLSGSEWGNLLLWENGLIVAEICLKQDIPCHEGIVRHVLHFENEFYTAGQDGWIRTWPFDTVDSAEIYTTEDSLKVSVKSSCQVLIKENSDIWYIVQDYPDESSNSVFWFAQDGRGAIWRADLCFLNTAKDPYTILTAHGGPIVGCATSKINCIMATLGADGQIRVYDYMRHRLLASRTFSSAGTVLLWPGTSFDSDCCTMFAGFADGTFRVVTLSGLENTKDNLPMSLLLHQVRKPHSRHVTCIDIESTGTFLATGSEDGTVFFFDIINDYAPLVFVTMPDYKHVISLKWMRADIRVSLEDDSVYKLLVALDGATLLELAMPNMSDIDNTITYHFMGNIYLRRIDLISIKSELIHIEELEMERIAQEQANELIESENRRKLEEGLESESEQNLRLLEEAEEMEKLKEAAGPKKKWTPYIPPSPSPIALMIPSVMDPEEIFLSMDGYDTGYLYMMRFTDKDALVPGNENPREPVNATKIEDSRDTAATAFAMAPEGDFVFWGFADGRIRVQNLQYPYAVEHIDKHWTEGIHDCIRGKVTAICLDKDGVFLFTTGLDGNCFLLSRMSDKDLDAYVKKEVLQPVPISSERTDIVDITDPSFYTLEVYKRVAKELALLAEAKKNKTAKREAIARLRLRYNEIIRKNNDLPEDVRLTSVELSLTNDKEVRKKEEYDANLRQMKIETAWDTERSTVALNKLKNFYKDNVAYELFELKAFNMPLNVWSYRLSTFPNWFHDAKDLVTTHVTPHPIDSDTFQEDISPAVSESCETEKRPTRTPGMDKFVYQRLVRIWERKQKKVLRSLQWRSFLRTEPKGRDLREEDRAIDEARANMGDMKLKSAADYKVPETKKLTEHRARKRLVKLEETMYMYKSEFNECMFQLREEKIKRLERMNEYKDKISECQKVLSVEDIKAIPEIKAMCITENPNRTLEYTVEDVKVYKRQIEDKLKAAAPVTKVTKKQEGPAAKRKGPGSGQQKVQAKPSKELETVTTQQDIMDATSVPSLLFSSYMEPYFCVLSPLEQRIRRTEIIKAKFWQDHYLEKIAEEKTCFDVKLKLLRHRKLKLDYLLKTADARLVLLTQEFILAQQSEALEASLESKIHNTAKEKRECLGVMKTINKKLDVVKKEMEQITRQKQLLLNEVIAVATARAPTFEKYLVRVFNKRMPKAKVRPTETSSDMLDYEGSDDEDSSDSSDDDMDLDDEDEDGGLDPDFPPPELSQEIYDCVVDIRERRYKVDEVETKTRETLEELTQSMNQYRVRASNADREFERGRRELDSFRKEKQEKQNVLNCAVSMKLHQIEVLGKDFSNALVTENKSIQQLSRRIPELQKEKLKQKKLGGEMKKFNLQLHREKIHFQKRLVEMQKKCDEEMLRKFGQIRPVEELEFFAIDPRVVKLKAQLMALEERHHREMEEWAQQICEAEIDLKSETSKCISRLYTVAYVSGKVHSMNKDMEEQMKKLPSELEDTIMSREIAFLKVVLTDQWNTISSLSLEIAQLTQRPKKPLPPITPGPR